MDHSIGDLSDIADDALDSLASAAQEIERLKAWVNDLQAGMYINCVYCGHRYGPDTEVPESMAEVLKEHIEQCPEHPMSKIKKHCEGLEGVVKEVIEATEGGEVLGATMFAGFKQSFSVDFVRMLKESLKGGYRDSALELLNKQVERQKELITRKDEQFGVARDKNEALIRGLEQVHEKLKEIHTSCSKDFNGSKVDGIDRLAMDASTLIYGLLSDDPERG